MGTLRRSGSRSGVGHNGPVHTVDTTPATDPTAVVGRRFLAAAIDVGILWVFTVSFWLLASQQVPAAVTRLGIEPCSGKALCSNIDDRYVEGWPMALLALVWAAYLVGVFVVQRGLTGRTVGTMLTGLVTVDGDGHPLGVGRALVRSVAGVVDYVPCCVPLVGIVTVAATPDHRRVGDMAASSYVVDHEWFGRRLELRPSPPPAPVDLTASAYPSLPPTPPIATPPMAPVAPATPPGAQAGPVWDPQRRAYIQWDPARRQWLLFDQATQEWQRYDEPTGRWRPLDR